MAKTAFTLTPALRVQMMNLLPQDAGSLRESIQVKRLRDKVNFTEKEQEMIDLDPNTGSIDPSKLHKLEEKEISLGSNEREILAGVIVEMEDEGEVPTSDAFIELALTLEDDIESFRDSLD